MDILYETMLCQYDKTVKYSSCPQLGNETNMSAAYDKTDIKESLLFHNHR